MRQSINKKGAQTPGSVSSVPGDKEGELAGVVGAAEAAVALPEGGGGVSKPKNVAWEDTEKEEEAAEKVGDRW